MDEYYGSCCVCEKPDTELNVFQMDYKNPVPSESAWGCFTCNLPMEGAVAVVCDECVEAFPDEEIWDKILFLMDGATRRIPVPDVKDRISHEHDLSEHPELRSE